MKTREQQPLELLIFELGDQRYGLPVADVREIVRAVPPVPLPGVPAGIEGVINIRGNVVPVLDLRRQFGLPAKPLEHTDHLVIARVADRVVALRVDRATELARLAGADVADREGLPAGAEHLAGVAKLSGGLVLIQDLRALLARAEFRLPPAGAASAWAAGGKP